MQGPHNTSVDHPYNGPFDVRSQYEDGFHCYTVVDHSNHGEPVFTEIASEATAYRTAYALNKAYHTGRTAVKANTEGFFATRRKDASGSLVISKEEVEVWRRDNE